MNESCQQTQNTCSPPSKTQLQTAAEDAEEMTVLALCQVAAELRHCTCGTHVSFHEGIYCAAPTPQHMGVSLTGNADGDQALAALAPLALRQLVIYEPASGPR